MENRGGQQRDVGIPNFLGFTPSQFNQESSPVKLPLAPIVSTTPDRIRGNATRRGCSIFSPTLTLDHHPLPPPPPPPPPPVQKNPTPDPDPPTTSPGGASNSKSSTPPPSQQPQEPSPGSATVVVRYRECLKNHAAKMGGHVMDGCGEFMPSGEEGTREFLRCAACDCHRNFHRKEVQGSTNTHHAPLLHGHSPPTAPPQQNQHKYSHTAPVMVAFGGNGSGAAADSSSEDLNMYGSSVGGHAVVQPSKKRFRTKFNQEQKDKMRELAVKIGWRIQKQDEEQVQELCKEIGVKREVFKVWLHNNKQAMKKRQI